MVKLKPFGLLHGTCVFDFLACPFLKEINDFRLLRYHYWHLLLHWRSQHHANTLTLDPVSIKIVTLK